MKKEEYSYGIIYKNLNNKKKAKKEIEGICPCCGKDDNLKTEERIIEEFKQIIYQCPCGTKWRGNFYNKNEEIVTYKEIKRSKQKEKLKEILETVLYSFFDECFFIWIIIFFSIALIFLSFKPIEEKQTESILEYKEEIIEVEPDENIKTKTLIESNNLKLKENSLLVYTMSERVIRPNY